MDADETRAILEGIARESSNPNARVSAIRALRRLDEDEQADRPTEPVSSDKFAFLDAYRERHKRS